MNKEPSVVILSVPYCEPVPMVAPALLSGCLKSVGINAYAIDFGIRFMTEFIDDQYWSELKNLFALGIRSHISRRTLIKLFKFIKKQLVNINAQYRPTHVGLSIFTDESINFSYLLIPFVKKYIPDAKIILGGRGLELTCGIEHRLHYEKYYDHGMADLVIVGDSETAIIEAIEQDLSGIYFAKPQDKDDLANIPPPDWSNYNFDLYKRFDNYEIAAGHDTPGDDPRYIAITGSKGCVRHCTFCDVESFWPKYLYRDGVAVAEEIIVNYKNTGMVNYRFTDNLINGSISHYRAMNVKLAEIIPNTIRYSGYAIFRSKAQMPEEDFILAKNAGCYAWTVGVESGSERVRYDMKKKFSNEDMDHGIINLHKNGIIQQLLLIVGYPTETESDFNETKNFLRRYSSLSRTGLIRIGITPTFMLLNNSPLIKSDSLRSKYGINIDPTDNLSRYFWIADINPENTFDVRYRRWKELFELVDELKYPLSASQPTEKWATDLENVKKVYDEKKPKKVFLIHPSK